MQGESASEFCSNNFINEFLFTRKGDLSRGSWSSKPVYSPVYGSGTNYTVDFRNSIERLGKIW